MKESFYIHSQINKQIIHNNVYNCVDSFNYSNLTSQQFKIKIEIESSNVLSELNIIKAQKSLLLKIVFMQKSRGTKDLVTETFIFRTNVKNKNISILFFLLNVIKQRSKNSKTNMKYIRNYRDLLLELTNLNFFKINLNSLSDINIIFNLFKNNDIILNKWLTDETFNKKRF